MPVKAGCFSEISPGTLPGHPLQNFLFNSLQVPLSFDLAIEVLVELGVPQILLCRVHYLKEVLIFPTLTRGDIKVIGGVSCLLSEIGQAAPSLIVEASAEALALTYALLRNATPEAAIKAVPKEAGTKLHRNPSPNLPHIKENKRMRKVKRCHVTLIGGAAENSTAAISISGKHRAESKCAGTFGRLAATESARSIFDNHGSTESA
ncbi:hypothetical protein Fmac_028379 [Flemingia macrophylla]|uniref:Uncharacterized protein n=1 Tax=Flemingia macrophylla TaxID=520843 RepID=A0ABD1L7B1_9FABA